MIVIVCGTRKAAVEPAQAQLHFQLDEIRDLDSWMIVYHGACHDSPDMWAEEWAMNRKVPVESFPAEWEKYGVHKAGHIRNQQMADAAFNQQGNTALCVAVWDGKSGGTLSMMKKAIDKGFHTIIIPAKVR